MLYCKIGEIVYFTYPTSGDKIRMGQVVDIRDTETNPVKKKTVPRHSRYLITIEEWTAEDVQKYRSFYHGYAEKPGIFKRLLNWIGVS